MVGGAITKVLIVIAVLITAVAIYALTMPLDAERGGKSNLIFPHEPYTVSPEAQKLHDSLVVADWHVDTLMWLRSILESSDIGQVDVPRLEQANMAIQVFPSVTRVPDAGINLTNNEATGDKISLLAFADKWPGEARTSLYARAAYHADKLFEAQATAPDKVKVILKQSDLQGLLEARQAGSKLLGTLLATEGLHPLEGKLDNVENLYNKGFRIMGLFHFFDNELGGSLHGISHAGLSEFGKQVVTELNRQSIIVDVAHASEESVKDVLALSDRPVILSHTGIHGVCGSARNISDELMLEIAKRGGVIGIGYWTAATCEADPIKAPGAIVDHLRYAIDLLGVEHVSLGSDYDGSVDMPFDVSEIPVLTHVMLKRGFTEVEIRTIMGGNIIRILSEQLPIE